MPKKKEIVTEIAPRFPRRAASKEALKQLHKIVKDVGADSPETLEINSDDEEVVAVESTPKKKYKISHRKSADGNDRDVIVLKTISYEDDSLLLDSWTDDLSPAQIAMRNATKKEIDDINNRLQNLLKETPSEIIFTGDNTALYSLDVDLSKRPKTPTVNSPPPLQPAPIQSVSKQTPSISSASLQSTSLQSAPSQNNPHIQLVMDARSGVVVGTMTPATTTALAAVNSTTPISKAPQTRKRTRAAANLQSPTLTPPSKISKVASPALVPSASITVSQREHRATEATAVGGLSHGTAEKAAPIVDLTSDESRAADSREVSFNKLQGKTFPSLVVVARPHLRTNLGNNDRHILDAKVKAVLMHIPTKFTEWLIQVGLIRSEQMCPQHRTKLKLGMYSDVSKFPFSGGYVWISECCPNRFVSVFSNSIFENSPHPPTVILKLIYHWACQTNAQNVVQWVKVDNLYVKGMNTWLRAICTSAIHTHLRLLGKPEGKVEVGVISLGTTSQDGNQRQVKVEVLGILDVATKYVRLKAVEPMNDGERNYRKRFSKILEPLATWVHPSSIIITDLTVDKVTLHLMGFKNVIQSSANDSLSNVAIMDYLRKIVPRMFQNTLSLLSRQIIQQFLDELVWRECFGTSPGAAFDNIVSHIAEQTSLETGNLVQRITKIASNPFKDWSIRSNLVPISPALVSTTPTNTTLQQPSLVPTVMESSKKTYKGKIKSSCPTPETSKLKKPVSPDIPEQMVPLEHYYYGTIDGTETKSDKVLIHAYKCGMCKSQFANNIKLMYHLFSHVQPASSKFLCRYCLTHVATPELLDQHIQKSHPSNTKFNNMFLCVICESKFHTAYDLGKHMSREHVPSELPYQCVICKMRCSNHKQAVDHFYEAHDGGYSLQCPLCLKCLLVFSNGRTLTQNMSYFVQHLQKHCKKMFSKKCQKCSLWFVQKDALREHRTKMHTSMRKKAGLVPWPLPRAIIMVPKSKQDEPEEEDNIDVSKLIINTTSDKFMCKECGAKFNIKDHFPSIQNCSNDNCQFTTCCKRAMVKHINSCKDLKATIPPLPLPFRMFCVCGHSDTDGNSLAKHLTVCERKSAYPSEAEAKAATVTHSMLDVLGLMRRTEEPTSSNTDLLIKKSETRKKRDDEIVKMTVDLCDDDDDSLSTELGGVADMKVELNQKVDRRQQKLENGIDECMMDITECVSVDDDVQKRHDEDED